MISPELSEYIRKAREQNMAHDEILTNLRNNGWKEEDIQEALSTPVATAPSIPSGQLMSASELIRAAWEKFKSVWKTAVMIQLIPALIVIVPGIVFGAIMVALSQGKDSATAMVAMSGMGIVAFLVFIPLILVAIVISLWAQVALYKLFMGGPRTWKEAYGASKQYIGQYFLLSAVIGLVTMAGFFLFVVPGMILSVMLFAAYPILFSENLKGFDALAKSRWYAQGYKLEIFLRYFVFFLLMVGVFIALMFVAWIPIIGNFIGTIAQIIITPFSIAFSILLYENIKRLKANQSYTPAQGGRRFFQLWAIGGVLAIPLFIVMVAISAMNYAGNSSNYIYDQEQGGEYYEDFDQYLPEEYKEQLDGTGLDQETMDEINKMMEEYEVTPIPRPETAPDEGQVRDTI